MVPANGEYLDILGVQPVAGTLFTESSAATDRTSDVVINEAAAQALGFTPEEAGGKTIYHYNNPCHIIGVVTDLCYLEPTVGISPLMFEYSATGNRNGMNDSWFIFRYRDGLEWTDVAAKANAVIEDINPNAHIKYHTVPLDSENIDTLLNDHDVAINALEYQDNTPFLFDEICKKRSIPVLHPFNFGWAGFVTVVDPFGHPISELSDERKDFELKVAEYVVGHGAFWNRPKDWLDNFIMRYKRENGMLPLPELSIASWITAGLCTTALYHLATGRELNYFPKYYLSSLLQ